MLQVAAFALLAAAVGTGASAQPPIYTTVDVYESCTDTSIGTDTITSTVVETTCPLCTGMAPTPTNSNSGQMTHTTIYTTVFSSVCSTGFAPVTYTVTETCTGPTPSFSNGPSYVPQGYTTTVTVCTACAMGSNSGWNSGAPTPWTVTLTVPCSSTPNGDGGGPVPTDTNGPAPSSNPAGNPQQPISTISNPVQPSNGINVQNQGTTTTETVCPGNTMCHHTSTQQVQATSRVNVSPYSGAAAHVAAATPLANALAGIFAVGAALL